MRPLLLMVTTKLYGCPAAPGDGGDGGDGDDDPARPVADRQARGRPAALRWLMPGGRA
ncbi:hypothetical protein [Streptomyces echinoruber]|uniref:Uncharacterized protein n=1 Tax=Streptomyces echinoruber TaxID=68898 RepID=A0A918R1A6_9ACTN|nr:hypothetical protein [Streptomyces echinoruber]GGZ77047.1 hypothetical protein GCM10010389_13440 [Streptomyces echinoruber]